MKIGFLTIDWTDILDITLVSLLLYQVYYLVRGSIASRVFTGYMMLYIFYLIIKGLGLELMTAILQYFMGVGAVALIVIFQQEIRRFLLILGKSAMFTNNRFLARFFGEAVNTMETETLKTVVEAARAIAAEFNGALIVVRKRDELDKYAETGVMLNALVSKPLLIAIFSQYSNLNEGAVIIADGRMVAAHCVLPVMEGNGIPETIGFRHRAAMGMSDATDAAVIVISEQTGKISLAINSRLISNLSAREAEVQLNAYLNADERPATGQKSSAI